MERTHEYSGGTYFETRPRNPYLDRSFRHVFVPPGKYENIFKIKPRLYLPPSFQFEIYYFFFLNL